MILVELLGKVSPATTPESLHCECSLITYSYLCVCENEEYNSFLTCFGYVLSKHVFCVQGFVNNGSQRKA